MKKLVMLAGLAIGLGNVAGATPSADDLAKEFRITKKASPLCDLLSRELNGFSSYSANIPFFILKEYNMISLVLASKISLPSSYDRFSEQKWEDLGNDFVKFTATTKPGVSPSENITIYFDTHERFKTDICISTSTSK